MKNLILLPAKHMIELTPTAPFHFDATLFKPDHFLTTDYHWEPGVRWQTMLWQNQPLGLKLENRAVSINLTLPYRFGLPASWTQAAWIGWWRKSPIAITFALT